MAHSIELIFDPAGEEAIVGLWQNLTRAGLPSQLQVVSDTNRPHVTLVAAQRISANADTSLRWLASALPVECVLGAPVLFTGARTTLARLIVPSVALLTLQERVYRLCLPSMTRDPFAHCVPGRWTAHATLGRRYTAAHIGAAFALEDDTLRPDLLTRLVGLRRWDGDNRVDHLLIGGAD